MTPDHQTRLPVPSSYDLSRSLWSLRAGPYDPTWRLAPREAVHALFGPEGPVTVAFLHDDDDVLARCWGPGSAWLAPRLHRLLGLDDDPSGFQPAHPRLAALAQRATGVRLPVHPDPLPALATAILEQRVAWKDAVSSWRGLCHAFGLSAPGPYPLVTTPDPDRLAAASTYDLRAFEIDRHRAGTLIGAWRRRITLRRLFAAPPAEVERRLQALPGVGPWTAAMLAVRALGHADAVPTGDLHLPHSVAWTLAGIPRGDDDMMLRLLEPYRPHRGRIVRLLVEGGGGASRRAV